LSFDIAIVLILLLLNIPIYRKMYRWFFANDDEYSESVRYTFTPNIVSFFRGEYWKDRFATARLNFFILACVIVIFVEYLIVSKIVNWIAS